MINMTFSKSDVNPKAADYNPPLRGASNSLMQSVDCQLHQLLH